MAVESVDSSAQTANIGAQFLEEILSLAHPLMAEAMTVAAIPHWYDLPLFTTVRAVDDERNEGLIPRLATYSFIIPIPNVDLATFRVRTDERIQLNRRWIESDSVAYLAAQARAFAYCDTTAASTGQTFVHDRLYHHFFVDFVRATDELIQLFRTYSNERHLAAIENMLDMAAEAHSYLQLIYQEDGDKNDTSSGQLSFEELTQFDDLIRYFRARLAQLHGDWQESKGLLQQLRNRNDLSPVLLPFVTRAYGNTLAQSGRYVEAIHELETSITQFDARLKLRTTTAGDSGVDSSGVGSGAMNRSKALTADNSETERAFAMIDLGEAYVNFAVSARGGSDRDTSGQGMWHYVQALFDFVISGPLIIYLSAFLGMRVWHPRFWPTLRNLDWMIARLFATGARYFQHADPILERTGTPTEGVLADERLAFLFLNMGDAAQAEYHFKRLLTENDAPLGDYRRARIQVGLSESYLHLDQAQEAMTLLHETLPAIEAFADLSLETQAQSLLAEAYLLTGDHRGAEEHLEEAISGYIALEELASATDLVERCDALSKLSPSTKASTTTVVSTTETTADTTADREEPPHKVDYRKFGEHLPFRQYAVGYRHPALVLFRRLVVFLLPLAVVLALLSSIRLDTDISLAPTIEFRAAPLLDPDQVTPAKLSQGFTAATISVTPNPSSLLPWALSAVTGYMGLSLLLGVFVIASTSLKSVQESGQTSTVRVDDEGLTEGEGEDRQSVRWRDVSRFARADVRIWRKIIPSSSSFGLDTEKGRVVIGGTAKWYTGLQKEILARLPESARRITLGYSVIRTASGVLYLLNLLVLTLVALFAWLRPESRILWQDLLGAYSIVDLYPFLYAGLFLFPLWWGVIRPLHIISYLGERGRQAWGNVICALIIFATLIALFFRPLLTVPDLYPGLIVLVALTSAGFTFWSLQIAGQRVYSAWQRALLLLLLALPSLLLIGIMQREVRSYHFLVVGNSFRDLAQSEELSAEEIETLNTSAVQAYSSAIEIGRSRIGPFSGERMLNHPLGFSNRAGFPEKDTISWLSALKNRAALQAQMQNVIGATADYDEILKFTDKPDQVFAWKAMAQQRAATMETGNNDIEIAGEGIYEQALQDYDKAIEINPSNPQYYLWRGVTRHTIGGMDNLHLAQEDYKKVLEWGLNAPSATRERAYSGLGWALYDTAEKDGNKTERIRILEEAENAFVQATLEDAKNAEAWLGLGYARYSSSERPGESGNETVARLEKAQKAWERASREDPQDPVVLISLGTLHWKMGVELQRMEELLDSCVEYSRSVAYFADATDRENLREQSDADVAFTYRTIGQVEFLLRNCAEQGSEYDRNSVVLERSVAAYTKAIELDSDVGKYHQMHGRLSFAQWTTLPNTPENEHLLYTGLADLEKSVALGQPFDGTTTRIYNWLLNALVPLVFERAQELLDNGEVNGAVAELSIIVEHRPLQLEQVLQLVQSAIDNVDEIVQAHPELEVNMLRKELQDALALLSGQNPLGYLSQGLNALNNGDTEEAIAFYRRGLDGLDDPKQIEPTRDMLMKLLAAHGDSATADDLLLLHRDALPQMSALLVESSDVAGLTALGAIALAVDEIATAGDLYARAIQSTAHGRNQQYSTLRNSWPDWRTIWHTRGSSADGFLQAVHNRLTWRLEQAPELDELEHYWGVRAWFQYWIGRAAFRVEDEAAAGRALQWAQPDADRAFEMDSWISGDEVHTYLPEAALGWYHVERGDDRFDAGDFVTAFADYEAATALIQPEENQTAREEAAIAAFKAGRAAFALGNLTEAADFYALGLDRTKSANAPSVAATRAGELNALLSDSNPEPYATGERRVQQDAVDALFDALVVLSLYAAEASDLDQARDWLSNASLLVANYSDEVDLSDNIDAALKSVGDAIANTELDEETKEALANQVRLLFQPILESRTQ